MRMSTLVVMAVAALLAVNVSENVLLISAALLPGAESYQTLGDLLIVNLVAVYLINRSVALEAADRGDDAARDKWLVPALLAGTAACGLLVGSNKLLLAVAGIGLSSSLGAVKALLRRPWAATACAVLLVTLSWQVTSSEAIGEFAGLTRLLDYGAVSSIWEAPSVASRLDIIVECGLEQLSLAPITGDLAAEYRTCGEGHYLHSLVSVQTHLGLIGTALFALVILVAIESLRARREVGSLLTVSVTVGTIAVLSAFFTWMPLWCVVALLSSMPREPRLAQAPEECAGQAQTRRLRIQA